MLIGLIFASISLLTVTHSAPRPYFTQSFVQTPTASYGQYVVVPDKNNAYRVPASQVRHYSEFQFPRQQVVYYSPTDGTNQHALHTLRKDSPVWRDVMLKLHEKSDENLVKDLDGKLKREDSESMKESSTFMEPIVVSSEEYDSAENEASGESSVDMEAQTQKILMGNLESQGENLIKNSTDKLLKIHPEMTRVLIGDLNKSDLMETTEIPDEVTSSRFTIETESMNVDSDSTDVTYSNSENPQATNRTDEISSSRIAELMSNFEAVEGTNAADSSENLISTSENSENSKNLTLEVVQNANDTGFEIKLVELTTENSIETESTTDSESAVRSDSGSEQVTMQNSILIEQEKIDRMLKLLEEIKARDVPATTRSQMMEIMDRIDQKSSENIIEEISEMQEKISASTVVPMIESSTSTSEEDSSIFSELSSSTVSITDATQESTTESLRSAEATESSVDNEISSTEAQIPEISAEATTETQINVARDEMMVRLIRLLTVMLSKQASMEATANLMTSTEILSESSPENLINSEDTIEESSVRAKSLEEIEEITEKLEDTSEIPQRSENSQEKAIENDENSTESSIDSDENSQNNLQSPENATQESILEITTASAIESTTEFTQMSTEAPQSSSSTEQTIENNQTDRQVPTESTTISNQQEDVDRNLNALRTIESMRELLRQIMQGNSELITATVGDATTEAVTEPIESTENIELVTEAIKVMEEIDNKDVMDATTENPQDEVPKIDENIPELKTQPESSTETQTTAQQNLKFGQRIPNFSSKSTENPIQSQTEQATEQQQNENVREGRINKAPTMFLHNNRFYVISGVPEFYANFDAYQNPRTPIFSLQELQPIRPMSNVAVQRIEPFRIYADEKSSTQDDNEPLSIQKSISDNPPSDIENEKSMNVDVEQKESSEMMVKVKKQEQDRMPVSEAKRDLENEEETAIAQANPEALSIAGPRGISSAAPRGSAVTGDRGFSQASPEAIAVAGRVKLTDSSEEDEYDDLEDDVRTISRKRLQNLRRVVKRARINRRL